jgi:hypothetical protein
MPRGQSSARGALAHLLAAHSIATPKQANVPIFAPTLQQLNIQNFDIIVIDNK